MSVPTDKIMTVVTEIVSQELGVPASTVTPDANLREVEGADSVKVLRVIAKIERRYDVELEDEDIFGASSVRDVADVVARAVAAEAA
jgi:acyl carrier protein